jgi:GLPGLI family protein
MKKILFSALLLTTIASQAQMKEGKVVYERTMQFQFRANNPALANNVPRMRQDHFELAFGNNQSLWQIIPQAEAEGEGGGTASGPWSMVRMGGINDVTHFNFTTGRRVDQREMFDREFLVEDSVRKLAWKISEETKDILGYTARKAIVQRVELRPRITMENGEMKRETVSDTSAIVAWFTTTIPVPAGPQEFQGSLPGLILELDANNGRVVYKAVEISPKVNLSSIKEPKGGKHVTAAEFTKERDALLEEMRKNNTGGNRERVIRMN